MWQSLMFYASAPKKSGKLRHFFPKSRQIFVSAIWGRSGKQSIGIFRRRGRARDSRTTRSRRHGKGVFLVKMKNAFVPIERVYSMNTYSRISTVPRGSERSEWASWWTEGASKRSEQSEAEHCGASEWSERCDQTNVASPSKTRSSLTRNAPTVIVISKLPKLLKCKI